jgi:hypothetical protein
MGFRRPMIGRTFSWCANGSALAARRREFGTRVRAQEGVNSLKVVLPHAAASSRAISLASRGGKR